MKRFQYYKKIPKVTEKKFLIPGIFINFDLPWMCMSSILLSLPILTCFLYTFFFSLFHIFSTPLLLPPLSIYTSSTQPCDRCPVKAMLFFSAPPLTRLVMQVWASATSIKTYFISSCTTHRLVRLIAARLFCFFLVLFLWYLYNYFLVFYCIYIVI